MGMTPMFSKPEDMQTLINEYFVSCIPEYLKDDKGQYILSNNKIVILNLNKPTMTGLALHLGFESRQSLYDYEDKEDFSYTVKRAKLMIEHSYEVDIRNPDIKPVGAIFGLKNFGWSDKHDIDIKVKELPRIEFSSDDPEEDD